MVPSNGGVFSSRLASALLPPMGNSTCASSVPLTPAKSACPTDNGDSGVGGNVVDPTVPPPAEAGLRLADSSPFMYAKLSAVDVSTLFIVSTSCVDGVDGVGGHSVSSVLPSGGGVVGFLM